MPRAIAEEATIQWYPGHMARAMRRLAEDMRAIDIVVEVADARVPHSGTNTALGKLAGNRPRLLVLSRAQLADEDETQAWLAHYRDLDALAAERRSARVIVLGIPNAGKSTAINALAGRNVARAEDRAGVTRARQWFRMNGSLEIMDTAGILVPRIDTPDAQWKLALVGAVPRARFDAEDIVARFTRWLREERPQSTIPDLETFAQSRGFVRRGTMVDTHNAAWAYLKDLGDGKFGKISLERP
jgi:ribosome biogenesis GTPase A